MRYKLLLTLTEWAAFLALSFVLAFAAVAQQGIQGQLLDADGKPAQNVCVELWQDDSQVASASTDAEGRFSFETKPGRYFVTPDRDLAYGSMEVSVQDTPARLTAWKPYLSELSLVVIHTEPPVAKVVESPGMSIVSCILKPYANRRPIGYHGYSYFYMTAFQDFPDRHPGIYMRYLANSPMVNERDIYQGNMR